jgi:hypothetical protein
MHSLFRRLAIIFSAGAVGGLINALAAGLYQSLTASTVLGIKLSQGFQPEMIYERVVWGGVWNAVFFLPMLFKHFLIRGLIYSLAPSLIQLFAVLPAKGQGLLGLSQGAATPFEILAFNAVWGVSAVIWLKMLKEE